MEREKIIVISITSILFAILIVSFVVIINGPIFDLFNDDISTYTLSYDTINVSTAKDLINDAHINLTIVDCTGGCQPCNWKDGHIPGANWNDHPYSLYNTTNDILVYCKEGGEKSINFCEQLMGHVYGDVYNLEGGYSAWIKY